MKRKTGFSFAFCSLNRTFVVMNKDLFKEMPDNYTLCIKTDCPMADHCLRQMGMQALTKRYKIVGIVNPLLTQPSEKCEFYRSDEPQIFARGFAAMKEEMLPRQYLEFMSRLKACFGRTGYFERRRGERLCSPRDIKKVEEVLKDLGLQHLEFDAYEQRYNWND
jgi:hypothetical protein